MFRFLFGVVIGLALLPAAAYLWFTHGRPPVAVADTPLPYEGRLAGETLHARIDREMTEAPAGEMGKVSEANLVAGAKVYREQCAFCHGVSGTASKVGKHMFPDAPPLWEKHTESEVVGVSDDPVGETYWKVANGIRLTGMPGYKGVLTEQEMWQVSLLLANADKALPPGALDLLKAPLNFGVGTGAGASGTTPSPAAPLVR
jgi:thiosulfate dehydrogenase